METTRRSFIGNVSLLAAGAGIGIPIAAGGPKRVMTEVRMILFSNDPIAIKAVIHSNEESDIFSIDMPLVNARMPLSAIRNVLEGQRVCFETALEAEKKTEHLRARAYTRRNMFFIEEDKRDAAPCWISLADVRRAVGSIA
jgi:hypothetical protein